jgi:hypothetical protein
MEKFTAIEIKDQETLEFVLNIQPSFNELDWETDLRSNFFVMGFPQPGKFAILTPESIQAHWDHIESDGSSVRLLKLVR